MAGERVYVVCCGDEECLHELLQLLGPLLIIQLSLRLHNLLLSFTVRPSCAAQSPAWSGFCEHAGGSIRQQQQDHAFPLLERVHSQRVSGGIWMPSPAETSRYNSELFSLTRQYSTGQV